MKETVMDLEQFDKQVEEVRRVLAQLPPDVKVISVHLSAHLRPAVHVYLPLDAEAYSQVARLCGLFGTPDVDHTHLVFNASPAVDVRASGNVRRFVSIPTSAQFVMPGGDA